MEHKGKLNELALFAGAGGGILGGLLGECKTVCAVEIDAYCAGVLIQRQNDGILPPFPVWDDVRTFDGRPWRGIVDVVSGGFPCQPFSVAGSQKGTLDERELFGDIIRIVEEVRPKYLFLENVPGLKSSQSPVCVCGWPHRRRGMYPHPETEKHLHSRGSDNNVRQGAGFIGRNTKRIRRKTLFSRLSKQEGMDVTNNVAHQWGASRYVFADGGTILDAETKAMRTSRFIARNEAKSGMDKKNQKISGEDEESDARFEPPRGNCPECGRLLRADARLVRYMASILWPLSTMGFDARWGVIGAADLGAPHIRERIWIVGGRQGKCDPDASRELTDRQADTRQRIEFGEIRTGIQQGWNEIRDSNRKGESVGAQYDEASWMQEYVADPSKTGLQSALQGGFGKKYAESTSGSWWETEPGMGRVVDGLAHRLDRIKALGNGQVPAVAAQAWELLR